MSDSLRGILLSSQDSGFRSEFAKLRSDMLRFARLAGADSEESRTVAAVLQEVARQGDSAVANYTKQFDRVELQPSEFRITAEDLAKAHASIDCELLASLRKAIGNVRAYQQRIFIGDRSEFSQGAGFGTRPFGASASVCPAPRPRCLRR